MGMITYHGGKRSRSLPLSVIFCDLVHCRRTCSKLIMITRFWGRRSRSIYHKSFSWKLWLRASNSCEKDCLSSLLVSYSQILRPYSLYDVMMCISMAHFFSSQYLMLGKVHCDCIRVHFKIHFKVVYALNLLMEVILDFKDEDQCQRTWSFEASELVHQVWTWSRF